MTLFKDRYRAESSRLKYWDYASEGYYFVTICTLNRGCFLGGIIDGTLRLSEVGKMAEKYWREIPDHFENIRLDEFIIMPNHIHGIVVIENHLDNGRDVACNVSTTCNVSTNDKFMSRISPKSGSLGAIIRSYKSALTRWCREYNHDFGWQARFYDHIIRDERSLDEIRKYISNNPLKWDLDEENPVNIKS